MAMLAATMPQLPHHLGQHAPSDDSPPQAAADGFSGQQQDADEDFLSAAFRQDWLPQPVDTTHHFQAKQHVRLAVATSRDDVGSPPAAASSSPVFSDSDSSDGADSEDAAGGSVLAGREQGFKREGRRCVRFGTAAVRTFEAGGDTQPTGGSECQCGGGGGSSSAVLGLDAPAGRTVVIDVKGGDGPAPAAVLLEGLIRRHHGGRLQPDGPGAEAAAAAVLAAVEPAAVPWLAAAGNKLGQLRAQIDAAGSAGLLPSMIRLTAEHAGWLEDLHRHLEAAVATAADSESDGDERELERGPKRHCH